MRIFCPTRGRAHTCVFGLEKPSTKCSILHSTKSLSPCHGPRQHIGAAAGQRPQPSTTPLTVSTLACVFPALHPLLKHSSPSASSGFHHRPRSSSLLRINAAAACVMSTSSATVESKFPTSASSSPPGTCSRNRSLSYHLWWIKRVIPLFSATLGLLGTQPSAPPRESGALLLYAPNPFSRGHGATRTTLCQPPSPRISSRSMSLNSFASLNNSPLSVDCS